MLDLVHDIVGAYRTIIRSMSYPGTVASIKEYSEKFDLHVPFSKGLATIMYMLLDSEVTFSVIGREKSKATTIISNLTYAKAVSKEEADYIFILKDCLDDERLEAIEESNTGTLINPHKSATIILEVDSLESGDVFSAMGPGIKDKNIFNMETTQGWNLLRDLKNEEFPLGIDMIFVSEDDHVLGLPRTTKVELGA